MIQVSFKIEYVINIHWLSNKWFSFASTWSFDHFNTVPLLQTKQRTFLLTYPSTFIMLIYAYIIVPIFIYYFLVLFLTPFSHPYYNLCSIMAAPSLTHTHNWWNQSYDFKTYKVT